MHLGDVVKIRAARHASDTHLSDDFALAALIFVIVFVLCEISHQAHNNPY